MEFLDNIKETLGNIWDKLSQGMSNLFDRMGMSFGGGNGGSTNPIMTLNVGATHDYNSPQMRPSIGQDHGRFPQQSIGNSFHTAMTNNGQFTTGNPQIDRSFQIGGQQIERSINRGIEQGARMATHHAIQGMFRR
ncbi:MAG: hypothetical protein KDJ26_03340 [Alphaproteobacteria bacterium]|nr:hypothetical protein [Alphaproteobacteria bacterium]MCB9985858.1 hypothetical protein [Micavibrio sp.]HPQ50551.1 hypothetical protein [Alphaproteobacteria bacterium]